MARQLVRVLWVACLAAALAGTARAQDEIAPLRVKVGQRAPEIALPAAGGGTVKLSQFRGRAVLVDFYRGYW